MNPKIFKEKEKAESNNELIENFYPPNISPKKKVIFSEINNRVQGSEVKKHSMISNSVNKKSSEAKNSTEFKKIIKKFNRMQSPQFEIKKNHSSGMMHIWKFFKTDSYIPSENSIQKKKWFTEGFQNNNVNVEAKGSTFLKKIFMEKKLKNKTLSKSEIDNTDYTFEIKKKKKKIKNKSLCKDPQEKELSNLFKSHVILNNEHSIEEFKNKSNSSIKNEKSKSRSNNSNSEMSLVYTRKIKKPEEGLPIHLDSFRKIAHDSPIKKEEILTQNPSKNIFKWQSGSIDSFAQNNSKGTSKDQQINLKINTKTPEFVKPPKLIKNSKFNLSSNQVLFSPKFKHEKETRANFVKGFSLNSSSKKKEKSNNLNDQKTKIDLISLTNPQEQKYSVLESNNNRGPDEKGNYSLMFTQLLNKSKQNILKNIKNKKSKSLLKIVNPQKNNKKNKLNLPSEVNKNRSAVLEGNWNHLKRIIDPNENIKRKYKTNDIIKSNKKNLKCRSLLPSQKVDSSEDEYNKKLTSFFHSKNPTENESLPLMQYESCKSQSVNDLGNIEADIQIPDFVNVYTEEVSQDTQIRRDSNGSQSQEMEERVTKNKYTRKGKIQISKDLLQQLKSNEDNFSSQTVTSNKKKRSFHKESFKSIKIKEIKGKKKVAGQISRQKTCKHGQAVKKVTLENRYKSNQNPSRVDLSKYGSFKGSSDHSGNNFKSFTQKLNLKKFKGSKQFITKDFELESQKRTSSALISSDGFNISRKYSMKNQDGFFNQVHKKLSQQNSNKRPKIHSEMHLNALKKAKFHEGSEKEVNLFDETSIENNNLQTHNYTRNSENYSKKQIKHASYEKSSKEIDSSKNIKKLRKKNVNLSKKQGKNNMKKYSILTSLKLPLGISESLKMTPINHRRRPPRKHKNKPPKLPKKSKTTKNKFYDSDMPFEKRSLFKSKMNYLDKKDKAISRRITDLNNRYDPGVDLKKAYTSGGVIKVRATPSNTSKNFSKRSNLKYELNYPKMGASKLTINSKESNLFSNEHNFIGSNSKKGNKNFNSHQVSKKNNEPVVLDNESGLNSSEFQKKYVINFENSAKHSKSKNINNIPEDSFRKNSKAVLDKQNKLARKDNRTKDEKRSKKNNFVKYSQNVSNTSNSKISHSKPMDNFSKQISRKKKRKRFQKHMKSTKHTNVRPKVSNKNFKSNRSAFNIGTQITPTLTSIDIEPFESIKSPEEYTLEDTNNIYIENYMRNVRENKSKKRKKSTQNFRSKESLVKDLTLTNYLDQKPQKFPNIYNITNKKKKSRINNDVNSTSNLHEKNQHSQSSFFNDSLKLAESRESRLTKGKKHMLMNQTSLLEKDFKRKSDLSFYKEMEIMQVPLQTFSKSILQKIPKKNLPVSQSNSLFFSKNQLNNNSLTYESPSQKSVNFFNENIRFSKKYNLLSKKKNRSKKKKNI